MPERKKILMLLCNYDPETHRGIARAAQKLGWHLNISMLNSFQTPTHWRGDGIICSLNDNKTLEHFVVKSGLPCVDLSGWRTDLNLPRVSADNQIIGELAVEHFCAFGHRTFGWFCHQQNPVAKARFQSYQAELLRRQLPPPSQLVGTRTKNTKEIETWLAEMEKPAALFAYNDNDAAWLLSSCLELGYRIPHDFAILGVDNNPLICELQPVPLSSINHNHERIGYEGAMMLNKIMLGQEPIRQIIKIKPNGITPRESTDAIAAQDPAVRKTISILKQNLSKPIGAPEIAEELGVSRRNLELRFKQALDTSIHKKLIELRLARARKLLTETEFPIEDIAAQTGFCNSPHLCRSFKLRYGLPPLTFRKNPEQEKYCT